MERIVTIFSDENNILKEVTVKGFNADVLKSMKKELPKAVYFIDWNKKDFGYIKDLK